MKNIFQNPYILSLPQLNRPSLAPPSLPLDLSDLAQLSNFPSHPPFIPSLHTPTFPPSQVPLPVPPSLLPSLPACLPPFSIPPSTLSPSLLTPPSSHRSLAFYPNPPFLPPSSPLSIRHSFAPPSFISTSPCEGESTPCLPLELTLPCPSLLG